MKQVAASAIAILLAGCGGGGDGSSGQCSAIGGSALAGMLVGSSSNVQNAVDNDLSTFASVSSLADGQLIADGKQFNGGPNTGIFVTTPSGTTSASMTVNTRMNGVIVETATGPSLKVMETTNTPATSYVGFNSTQPFNQIEFLFTNGGEYLVFEFCGSATLR